MNNQLQLNIENKHNKKYQYYKRSCESKKCDKIESYKNVDEILRCMLNCQFGYDYEEGKYERKANK